MQDCSTVQLPPFSAQIMFFFETIFLFLVVWLISNIMAKNNYQLTDSKKYQLKDWCKVFMSPSSLNSLMFLFEIEYLTIVWWKFTPLIIFCVGWDTCWHDWQINCQYCFLSSNNQHKRSYLHNLLILHG